MKRLLAAAVLLLVSAGAAAAATDRGSMQQTDTFRDAAVAPLEDLNVKQVRIPDVLKRAVADPYDVKGLGRCEGIAGEIGRLDAALGPDLDEAPPPDKRTRLQKAGAGLKDVGVAEVRDRTRSVLPFRGWIRKLTGAERHQKDVQKAIKAGGIRRGYLKGVGMRMNCAPPAAPSWFEPVKAKASPASNPLAALWSAIVRWFAGWWPF
jgi:hypothetical protein